jgi:hypothetical protein
MSNFQGGGAPRGIGYTGTYANRPPNIHFNDRDPNQYDTQNYSLMDFWLNTVSLNIFCLVSLAGNSSSKGMLADWVPLSTGGVGTVDTLTSNTGGAVSPLAGNINVVGDGVTITGIGNPGAHTITLSAVATGEVSTLTGNSGGAVSPAANNINVIGDGTTVNVVGNPGTNTLTISAVNTGQTKLNYTSVTTTPYVVAATDDYISVTTTSLAITVQLPNAPATGRVYTIKDKTNNASVNNITVTTVGGTVTIDGATTYVMNTNYEAINVIFNGTNYEVW